MASTSCSSRSTGEGRVDHIIIVAVFLIALGQALTILLTIRRERDIRELGKLVDRQRLQIAELSAWLAGRAAAQPRRTKSDLRPPAEPTSNDAKASEPKAPESGLGRAAEDETTKATKALDWQHHILAGLRAGMNGDARTAAVARKALEPEVAPKDPPDHHHQRSIAEEPERATKPFRWFKEDTEEPPGMVAAREIVAGLNGGAVPSDSAMAPKGLADSPKPSSADEELERATKAINRLKEDADKAREIVASMQSASSAKKNR
jgi:hypothetical protein